MKTYRISFTETDFDAVKAGKPRSECWKTVTVATAQPAKNGIEAIKSALRAKLTDPELLADLEAAWTGGSNKRLVLAGITFEANLNRG